MQSRLVLWSIVAALAGFLFGFDTVVISGAEKSIQALWDLSPAMHGIVMGSALYGTVAGAIAGAWPTDRWGRKKTLLWIGILYLVSAIWSGLATDPWSFSIARFIGGLGVGVSTVAAPLYISEISPPDRRGRLAGMFQFNIVFGILVAFLTNWLLSNVGDNSWRWMMGSEALPALIYSLACFSLPESPRWLMSRGRDAEATVILKAISPTKSDAEIGQIAQAIRSTPHEKDARRPSLWSVDLRRPVVLAFLIAFFNQLSGINAILYFAPRIFGLTGSENALGQSIGIGITNLIFTFAGLWLIDRLGRRTLLYIGSFGYILSLGLCAVAFFTWAPQFRAASAAVDVKAAVDGLAKANPARVAKLEEDLEKKKEALVAATAEPKSGAEPVTFSSEASPDAVKATANDALVLSSKAAGAGGMMVLVCIFAFIAAHAIGQGAVIWVFISEIFPDRCRAAGQSLGSATHWVFAAALTTVFPLMMAKLAPGTVFLFFTGMMVLQLIWVKLMVPETKGVPLEEMQQKLSIR
ncbi:sugar porter family MFS transporter [Luteolibacter arcticus]|uniref:Sugar porter family MFS transporter n=1 Tax=Luteolibacter arcticus TaxID=1581411 RepID=A0ABT3GSK6_9BACT|nr:sugar porter family MFS transporter [Luteolibacter arcticus]MCW1926506.1 sugar porter family MFS transporter [Luteolibacter arcticus]